MQAALWVNGQFVSEEEPSLTAVDRGFTLGDGVFETMRSVNGRIVGLAEHLARLRRGAGVLEIPSPPDHLLMEGLAAVLARLQAAETAVRLTLSRGPDHGRGIGIPASATPTLVIRAVPFTPSPADLYERGMRAVIVSVRRNETSPLSRIKSCNYGDAILARREAVQKGGEEALMLNTRGELACASIANLFVVVGGRLMTPPEESGALRGTMRGRVLQAARSMGAPAGEDAFGTGALFDAEEAFLTNALMGVMPLTSVDGRLIGAGRPGPVTARLREAIR